MRAAKTALCLAGVLSVFVGLASGQSMEERRDQKLAEPWLKAANWITDYDKALEASRETGKPIFAYFTRSYSP